MSTSQTAWFTKPTGDNKISLGVFGYINARIRQRAYDIVIREFKKSGITQAQLCRRWGKTPDYVSRFLSRPGNWEINTFAEALFSISGAIPSYTIYYASEREDKSGKFTSVQATATYREPQKITSVETPKEAVTIRQVQGLHPDQIDFSLVA
jgi:hypothetical protein